MREVVIAAAEGDKKGRSFSAVLLAYVTFGSDCSGNDGAVRPTWITFACSPAEVGPFVANLRLGRKAEMFDGRGYAKTRFELMKSAGYEYALQRHPQGTIVTAFLPGIFEIDPGVIDKDCVRFVLLPGRAWAEAERIETRQALEAVAHVRRVGFDRPPAELRALVVTSALFAAYLDRRTRCPLVPDLRFYLQVLVAALSEGLASLSCKAPSYYGETPWGQHRDLRFVEEGTEGVGLLPGVAFRATHEDLEKFLAEQVGLYFAGIAGQQREAA